jgi:hypothetical protein
MKKLIVAAATFGVAVSLVPALIAQAQAAPATSPYCNMPKASNNGYAADLSWAQYYGCWGSAPMAQNSGMAQPAVAAPGRPTGYQAAYCSMPKASNNGYAADLSWAEYYGCWKPHR